MSDEVENTVPEGEGQESAAESAPESAAEPVQEGGLVDGAEKAVEDAASLADEAAAQADEGAQMSDDEAAALAAAMSAISQVQSSGDEIPEPASAGGGAEAFESPEFDSGGSSSGKRSDMDLLSDVHMNVRIELGRTKMFVEDVLRLGDGAVVELDKLAGDPVDVYVNDRKVARGEVLVLNDNFCVRISEIVDLHES